MRLLLPHVAWLFLDFDRFHIWFFSVHDRESSIRASQSLCRPRVSLSLHTGHFLRRSSGEKLRDAERANRSASSLVSYSSLCHHATWPLAAACRSLINYDRCWQGQFTGRGKGDCMSRKGVSRHGQTRGSCAATFMSVSSLWVVGPSRRRLGFFASP